MAKSRRRKPTGTLDKIVGRVLEVVGKVTGKPTTKAKGRAARGRGHTRSGAGRMRRKAT